jgi:glycosyltransferase involved in cell wall biosynthesis
MNASPRHIGLFLPSLRGGGAERSMLDIAEGFVARGDRVDLVLANAEGPYLEQIQGNINVINLAVPRVRKSLPGLIRYLRMRRPEVLLSTPDRANIIAILARGLAGLPLRLFVREATTMSQSLLRTSPFNAWKRLQLVRHLYPKADRICAISRGVAEDLHDFVKLPKNKIEVVYNPVVTPSLLAQADQPIDHPWFLPGQVPVVLGVGRLSLEKDFSTLIRAFAHQGLRRRARLMILGEGEQRGKLENLIAELDLGEAVELPGFVKNPFAFMARSALFVHSSFQEGFGNVIVQAMAVGTPVVATNCRSGPAEILEDGRYGRLVPVGVVEAMSQAINEELTKNIGQDTGRRDSLMVRAACFSQENSIKAYSNLFFPSCLAQQGDTYL